MSFFKSKFGEELQKSKNLNVNRNNTCDNTQEKTDECVQKET